MSEELYLLQNNKAGYLGNSPMFWGENGGYTQWIDDAAKFTQSEAVETMTSCSSHSFSMWPLSKIEAAAKRTVDIQDLRINEAQHG